MRKRILETISEMESEFEIYKEKIPINGFKL